MKLKVRKVGAVARNNSNSILVVMEKELVTDFIFWALAKLNLVVEFSIKSQYGIMISWSIRETGIEKLIDVNVDFNSCYQEFVKNEEQNYYSRTKSAHKEKSTAFKFSVILHIILYIEKTIFVKRNAHIYIFCFYLWKVENYLKH